MPLPMWIVYKCYNGCSARGVCALESSSYTKIFICLSVSNVRSAETETQDAVSLAVERQKLETGSLYERQSRH